MKPLPFFSIETHFIRHKHRELIRLIKIDRRIVTAYESPLIRIDVRALIRLTSLLWKTENVLDEKKCIKDVSIEVAFA